MDEGLLVLFWAAVVVGVAIWAGINYPLWTAAAVLAALGIWALRTQYVADEKHRAEFEAREKIRLEEERQFRERQRELTDKLSALVLSAGVSVASLPTFLTSAQDELDAADFEFRDGAFAPFWGAVERASSQLERYHKAVDAIESASKEYARLKPELKSSPPKFDAATVYPDPSSIVARMNGIIRQAQRNFQFAAIFEQRTTNHILKQGFSSLAARLDDLGDRFERSIEDMGGRIVEAVDDAADRQVDAIGALGADLQEAAERTERATLKASENALERELVEQERRRKFESGVSGTLHDIHDDLHRRR